MTPRTPRVRDAVAEFEAWRAAQLKADRRPSLLDPKSWEQAAERHGRPVTVWASLLYRVGSS